MTLAVTASVVACQDAAQELALSLALPWVASDEALPFGSLFLELTPERLQVREAGSKTGPVYVDFAALLQQRKGGEAIRKALGKNVHTLIDATAGLGRDAFVLAAQGFQVTLLERVPVVAALLADGLRRGAATQPDIIARMHLIHGDAQAYLATLADKTDVVYLDPMFPERRKSAQVKKAMRFFHTLVGADADAAALLTTARGAVRKRVVVKRPRLAPMLGETPPHTAIVGKTTRFDVYLPT